MRGQSTPTAYGFITQSLNGTGSGNRTRTNLMAHSDRTYVRMGLDRDQNELLYIMSNLHTTTYVGT